MNPGRFFSVLRDKWVTLVITTAIGVLMAIALVFLTPTTFRSSAHLFLGTPGWGAPTTLGNAESSPFQGDEFSQQRAATYVRLSEGSDYLLRVGERLGQNGLREGEDISVRVIPDTILLEIAGTSDTADHALALTTAATEELNATIRRLETPSGTLIPVVQPVTVVQPNLPRDPTGPQSIPTILAGLVLGVMVGVTWVVLRSARSARIQSVEDLEAWTGLPVFESLPAIDGTYESNDSAELRSAFNRLQFNRDLVVRRPAKTPLLVTSVDNAQIARFVTQGLAEALYRQGETVVVLDCDFRSPHSRARPGVTDIVMMDRTLDELLAAAIPGVPVFVENGSPTEYPDAVLESEAFGSLVQQLSDRFDHVVMVDSGGRMYPDTGRLARLSGSTIVVVEETATDRRLLAMKFHDLESAGTQIEGSVLIGHSSIGDHRHVPVTSRPMLEGPGPSVGPEPPDPTEFKPETTDETQTHTSASHRKARA